MEQQWLHRGHRLRNYDKVWIKLIANRWTWGRCLWKGVVVPSEMRASSRVYRYSRQSREWQKPIRHGPAHWDPWMPLISIGWILTVAWITFSQYIKLWRLKYCRLHSAPYTFDLHTLTMMMLAFILPSIYSTSTVIINVKQLVQLL